MPIPKELQVDHLYREGYIPSSYDAPHSSLQRSLTWIAMGCILSSMAGFGTMTWGLSSYVHDARADAAAFAFGGAILGFGLLFLGFTLVHVGRKNYRDYKARTGRYI